MTLTVTQKKKGKQKKNKINKKQQISLGMRSMWLTVHLKEEKEEKNQRDRLRDYSQSVFFLQKNDGLLTRSS